MTDYKKHGMWIGGEIGFCTCCGMKGCASDIWNDVEGCGYCPNCGAKMDLTDLDSVDPPVRCKDCVFFNDKYHFCTRHNHYHDPQTFCGKGISWEEFERRPKRWEATDNPKLARCSACGYTTSRDRPPKVCPCCRSWMEDMKEDTNEG